MKDIIQRVLFEQTNLSDMLAREVAQKIVDALGSYSPVTDIGSRTEYEKSAT
jgi:hypothetical protein